MSASRPTGVRARRLLPVAAALAALALWAVLLPQAERSPFARVPVLDEVWYLDRAAALDGLSAPADEPHFMSPLYPLLIRLAGSGHAVPADRVVPAAQLRGLRLLQIACWFGTAALLRLLAGRLLPARAPRRAWLVWLPPLLFACYRPAAVYAVAVLLELPLVFLLTLALWLLTVLPTARRPLAWAAGAGAALALAGLLRGTAFVLVPAAAWWILGRAGKRTALAAVLAAALVTMPAVLHNTRAAGRVCGPSLNGGVNLLIGNGPGANGFYVAVIDGDWRADPAGTQQLAAELDRDPPGLAEADRIWLDRAGQAMAQRPLRAAGLWLRKVWLHLQGWEIDQLTPLSGWTGTVPVLRALVVPWALVVALALVGAVDLATGRQAGNWRIPMAGAGLLLAAQSLFFVVSRYRLALLPAAALLAMAGVVALLARRRAAAIALVPALLLVVPWGLGGVRAQWQAMGLANEALRYADLAQASDDAEARQRAEDLYRAALAAEAPGEAPWLGLAAVLEAGGAADEAARVIEQGAATVPRAPDLHLQAARHALTAGDAARAEPHLRAALAARPRDAEALHNLAVLRGRADDPAGAETLARRLVAAHPGDPRGWNDLGIVLARSGRRDEAAAVFRAGLARLPGDPDLQANLRRLDEPAAP